MNTDKITQVWSALPGPGFGLALALVGLTLLGAAVGLAWLLPRYPEAWRRWPRERVLGVVLGLWVLLWSARLAQPLLEGGLAGFRHALLPLALALTVGAYFFLDYLLVRSLGGLTILVGTWLMEQAFIAQLPARWLLSLVAYALGTVALYLLASPYRGRDWLTACTTTPRWRYLSAALLALAGAIPLVLLLMARR